MKIEQINYSGWENCTQISNGSVDLVITNDVGPRIIRFGFTGAENMFKEMPGQVGETGGDVWRLFGGHRLWHAPEQRPRTYQPDNHPVQVREVEGLVRVTQPTEPDTGIEKEMDIRLDSDADHVRVIHRLRNRSMWPVELAPWSLSVMAAGGTAILPLPARGTHEEHLVPTSSLTLWAYTDMSDPRWTWGREYILLRQDPTASSPQKVGAFVPDGWLAYANFNTLFVKRFSLVGNATYPDMNSTAEIFTNDVMLEVETLGPLGMIAPGASVEHIEHWYLYADVPTPTNDADVKQHILPRITQ